MKLDDAWISEAGFEKVWNRTMPGYLICLTCIDFTAKSAREADGTCGGWV
ncbi:MAG: hypothetical protein U0894_01695 [Pirellulales bacterium]